MDIESYLDLSEPSQIRLRGHRIDLATLVTAFNHGLSPEQIVQDYPTLTLEEVYGAITYYLHHRAAVDRYVRASDEDAERDYQAYLHGPQHPAVVRIRALVAQRQQNHP